MLAFEQYEKHVKQLTGAAIAAARPDVVVKKHLARHGRFLQIADHTYDLGVGRVFLVAAGKAAIGMSETAVDILDEALTAGIVVGKADGWPQCPPPLTYHAADHPIPSSASVAAATAVEDLLSDTEPADLVLCLISGGTSALLTRPLIPLDQWQELNRALLHSGCTINATNDVRQRLDRVKGGGLARMAAPATCATLILSDVIGNRIEHIGSGPTVPITPQPDPAWGVLEQYNVWDHLSAATAEAVRDVLANPEPALPLDPNRLHHAIIGDVALAAKAAATEAERLGFDSRILTTYMEGEAKEVGRLAAALAKSAEPNSCLILGGETTVTVRGEGRGGRNQEAALAAAIALAGWPERVVASVATDAEDGPTPAAGAVVSGETAVQAEARGLDPADFLARNDSFNFFQRLGKGHVYAQRDTNVNDLLFVLRYGVVNSDR